MKRRTAACLLLLALLPAAAPAEGEWNYVLKTDGTARLTRYVGGAETIPDRVDGFAVTEAAASLAAALPAGISETPEVPAAAGVTDEGLRYALDDRSAAVVGYEGEAERIIIPRQIGDRPVTLIAKEAFRDNWTVTHVLLPDTVEEIGDGAFRGCKRLEQIHFDPDVRVIGEYAFFGCDALSRVVLPKNLTCVGACAFAYTGLNRVSLPDALLVVGESAFDHAPGIGFVRLGSGVRVIERYAFAEAPLRRVKLPESVVRVGRGAFAKAAYLSAENADLKAALPGMGVTEADLTTRDWPEAEETPLFTLDADVPVGEPTPEPTPKATPEPTPELTPEVTPEPTPEVTAEPTAEPAEEQGEEASSPTVRITASVAKLRSRPSAKGTLLQIVHTGDTFPFVARRHGWYALTLPDGTAAYVAGAMAEVIGE